MAGQSESLTPKKRRQGVAVGPEHRPAAERKFLATLAKHGNVAASCRAARISPDTAYKWREQSAAFAAEWEQALEVAIQGLELKAHQRATEQSDTLMIFLLKAHRPEKYRETVRQEHTGPGGKPLTVEFVNDWRRATGTTAGAEGTHDE